MFLLAVHLESAVCVFGAGIDKPATGTLPVCVVVVVDASAQLVQHTGNYKCISGLMLVRKPCFRSVCDRLGVTRTTCLWKGRVSSTYLWFVFGA